MDGMLKRLENPLVKMLKNPSCGYEDIWTHSDVLPMNHRGLLTVTWVATSCLTGSHEPFPTVTSLPESSKFNNDTASNSTLMDQDHSLPDAPQETESEEQDRMKTLQYCFMINVHANTVVTRCSSIRTAKHRLPCRDPRLPPPQVSIPTDDSLFQVSFHMLRFASRLLRRCPSLSWLLHQDDQAIRAYCLVYYEIQPLSVPTSFSNQNQSSRISISKRLLTHSSMQPNHPQHVVSK